MIGCRCQRVLLVHFWGWAPVSGPAGLGADESHGRAYALRVSWPVARLVLVA